MTETTYKRRNSLFNVFNRLFIGLLKSKTRPYNMFKFQNIWWLFQKTIILMLCWKGISVNESICAACITVNIR